MLSMHVWVCLCDTADSVLSPQYSPDHVAGPGVLTDPAQITFPGCSCLHTPCGPKTCSCLHGGVDSYNSNQCLQSLETATTAWSTPVFECNALCPCAGDCRNRVVQRGPWAHLQVFKTQMKGWGLRTLDPIPRGRFVCEYAGEVLGVSEAQRRMQTQSPGSCNYILAVREHVQSGQVLETFVDPTNVGNMGRFLNHSCEPNLVMVPVRVDSMVPRLALFAARDILPEEELSYDYSGRFLNQWKQEGPEPKQEGLLRRPCYCGAASCATVLPYDDFLCGPSREPSNT